MRTISSITTLALAISCSALAQDARIEGSATTRSQTSVSATPAGAEASHRQSSSANLASEQASGSLHGGGELNAALDTTIDARRVQPGDEVTATVTDDMIVDGGVLVQSGARLVGRVTAAQPRQRGSRGSEERRRSHLGVVFDRAILSDGREIPLNATVHALAAAEAAASAGARDAQGMGSAAGAGRATGAARGGAGGLTGGAAGTAGGAVGGAGRVTGTAGGIAGAAGGTAGGVVGATGGTAAGTQGMIGGAAGAAVRAGSSTQAQVPNVLATSAGAVGGVDAAGRLMAGSRGVFGLPGLDIAPTASSAQAAAASGARGTATSTIGDAATAGARAAATTSAEGTLVTSTTRHVRLESGTRMLLVTGASAQAAR